LFYLFAGYIFKQRLVNLLIEKVIIILVYENKVDDDILSRNLIEITMKSNLISH